MATDVTPFDWKCECRSLNSMFWSHCWSCGGPRPKEKGLTILEEADAISRDGGERNDGYDHPRPNFEKTAVVWSQILGKDVTPRQVALCMIGLKLVRDSHKPKRDNLVDIAGYARCAERLDEQ